MKLHSNIIGSGKPILILHGFLGMGDNWKTFAKQLAEENFECHLIDQRNHGRSPHSNEFSYDLMADDLLEYCQQNDLEKVNLLGHSMGGKTAMRFACQNPQMIEKLVIVDITPKYYAPHHQTILNGLTDLSERELDSRGKADELLSEYIDEKGVRQFLLKNLYWKEKSKLALRMNLDVLKEKIESLGEGLGEDQKFEGQTLFVKGEKSNYITDHDRDLIQDHFPKSQLVTIKNSGHWVHAEQRDAFFEMVSGYLNS
jgi:pimeloyl-ACP methyl ester carboxylesterase